MKKNFIRSMLLLTVSGGALLLPGCKGRTMENMEPTGDTVEVIINAPEDSDEVSGKVPEVTADSIPD